MKRAIPFILCTIHLVFLTTSSRASDQPDMLNAWARLQAGTAVAIMRHALAPGTGDPAHFELGDCSTQRNLSTEGRVQASSIGDLFRSKGIQSANIISSEWCRCRETAQLLNLGKTETFSPLNSFFEDRSSADDQTDQLRKALPAWLTPESQPTVLVTHQVNIRALTGSFTRSGEILIISLNDDDVVVLANIPTLN